jgi:hypothetical protein
MQPHLRYLAYVLRHKWHVLIACRGLHVPLWQAIIHDWTKFLPCEWVCAAFLRRRAAQARPHR